MFPTNHKYIRRTEWNYEKKKLFFKPSSSLRSIEDCNIYLYGEHDVRIWIEKPSFNTWKCTQFDTYVHCYTIFTVIPKADNQKILYCLYSSREEKSVLARYQYLYSQSSHCWNRLMRIYFMVDIRTNSPKTTELFTYENVWIKTGLIDRTTYATLVRQSPSYIRWLVENVVLLKLSQRMCSMFVSCKEMFFFVCDVGNRDRFTF